MADTIDPKLAAETPYSGPVGSPVSGPVEGVSVIMAAQTDAMSIASGHESPYPGAALALGYSGVEGVNGHTLSVFKFGEIVATVEGTEHTDTVALALEHGVGSDTFGRVLRLTAA